MQDLLGQAVAEVLVVLLGAQNQNSYGLAEVSVGAGTFVLSSKDENGAILVDPTTAGPCTISQAVR